MMGQEGPFFSSQRKATKQVYPTRIESKKSTSPQGKRFQRSSPAPVTEAASRSHSGTEFQSHRASEGNGWFGRNRTIDDRVQQPSAMTTHNIFGRQRQRDLIDAFGNYGGKDTLNENFPKIQRIDVNGIKGVVGKMDWQNSEEEEYVWEVMSPTLADSCKRKRIFYEPSSRNLRLRSNSSRLSIISPKSDFRKRSWPVPPLKDLATVIDDKIAIGDYGFGPMNKMHLNDTGSTQLQHHESSQNVQEYESLPNAFHHLQDNLSPKSHAKPFQLPYLVSAEMPLLKLSSTSPDSLNMGMPIVAVQKTHQPSLASVIWPPAHNSQYVLPMPNNLQMENNKPVVNQQLFSVPFTQKQFDANEMQLFKQTFQENLGGFIPSAIAQTSADFTQPLNGVQPQSSTVLDSILQNSISGTAISAAQIMPDISLHGHATMPPLPPGPPPSLSHPITTPLNSSVTPHSSVIEYSGLICSLIAQGLISLTRPDQPKDTANLEFNAELLKIHCESAINSLYTELSRQCTTCGLRFKCQEDHSNHMDWHVVKNRMSRNRKQKQSRKWFVNAKEWHCGAETLGADAVPGFLPTETAPDKNENREMAVPADENQTVCALCGEPFEDFYSDETEEWMYRGAAYLNAPNGDLEGLDQSQLGPIVHVKCRSESAEGNG